MGLGPSHTFLPKVAQWRHEIGHEIHVLFVYSSCSQMAGICVVKQETLLLSINFPRGPG